MSPQERSIAASLLLAIAGATAFMVSYAVRASIQADALALAVCFAGFMLAAIGWSRWILPVTEISEARDVAPSSVTARRIAEEEVRETGREVGRRTALVRLLVAAAGCLGLAVLFPLRSLGPEPDDALFHTKWRRGRRLLRVDGRPVRRDDLETDSVVTVFPEGAMGDAQSQAVLIRLPDALAQPTVGYVAYSKICTHAGCPVALYRAADHQLICPCHQSVFDVVNGGTPISGPANGALPHLPIIVAADGTLRAAGDFNAPVGPGFWNHG